MNLEPTYTSIGKLFTYRPMFFIPKYQRSYAWETESVQDFVKDLKDCFDKRKAGKPINHFFGGILSVKYSVEGAVNQHEYEVIDGQQRISTFVLLVACLIEHYKTLKTRTEKSGDANNTNIIQGRIDNLSERFIEFQQEVQRKITPVEVLVLSSADRSFFKELVRQMDPKPTRDSHEKLSYAYKELKRTLQNILNKNTTIEEKIDDLEVIQNILDHDFTVLHMVTGSKTEAFRLFQVINDRGTSLTDGDLLRAKTLELLEGHHQDQNAAEALWDSILADPHTDTSNYLNWIYESHKGSRAQQNALFDKFLDSFFSQHKNKTISVDDARNIREKIKQLNNDIEKCRMLKDGQWPFESKQPITSWDRTRLNILLIQLGHTLSIPLLLAACELDHKIFSDIVQTLERTFFRYKIMCNQHVTPLKNIYSQEALSIRSNPANYNTTNLKKQLNDLITTKAPDQTFCNALEMLVYQDTGGSNKPLKYFLMTVEYYYQWYINGATGSPSCPDKSRIYDFGGTSIEHIYPRNASGQIYDINLDSLKNSLGNLTIMDPAQNSIAGDKGFTDKKSEYQKSSVDITKKIGSLSTWGLQEISTHKNMLIDAALKIFVA